MHSHKKFAGILLAGSLVSGVGVTAAGTAAAGEQARSGVTQIRTVADAEQRDRATGLEVRGVSRHQLPASGTALTADGTANRQFLPAWGVRLAVKAALQVIKKQSLRDYNKIIAGVRAGKNAFMGVYAKLPASVKKILPKAALSTLFEAIKWAVGL